jgi:hypothetical protein
MKQSFKAPAEARPDSTSFRRCRTAGTLLGLIVTCFGLLLVVAPATANEYPPEVLAAKRSISGAMLTSHIQFLASEHCRGRETGEPGMDVAIAYLRSVLQGIEVEPAGEYGGFLQPVPMRKVTLGDGNRMEITERTGASEETTTAGLGWDFIPVYISGERGASAPVVFAGYGITAPEHGYDDYSKLNVRGKVVLVMRHEPGENDPESVFDGTKISSHGTLLSKILNAQKHGAVGILFATDPNNHDDLTPSATDGTGWPSLRIERARKDEDFKFMRFSPRMRIDGDNFGVRVPAAAIDSKIAEQILGADVSLAELQERIDSSLTPRSFAIPNMQIKLTVDFSYEHVSAYNIIAKVKGSDPELADEMVVVGAHYDHVGKNNRGLVFGGADDNASGSAAVVELARAFQSLPSKPKRTILFVLFTAEEKGLLGSRYFVDHSPYGDEKIVAMVALDMIGRNSVDQISLIGRYQYPRFYQIIDAANRSSVNLDIHFSVEQWIRNSDHFPFMRKQIPSVLFNSGSHDQLHRPEDTAHRIIRDKIEKVSQLVFLSLWDTANLPPGTALSEGSEQ